jgi:hypothetical protein
METSGQSAHLGAQKQLVKYQRITGLRPNKCFGYARTQALPAALTCGQRSDRLISGQRFLEGASFFRRQRQQVREIAKVRRQPPRFVTRQ